MTATLAYLPFRIVYAPTVRVGQIVAWLAAGYREAPRLERWLIFPSWLLFRGTFLAGYALSVVLLKLARWAHGD